ncbi:helix-turn-helix domain-containing protein [Microbacterium maritypicum]|uniref:Helix-turn-helix domain-containing protein n=1 Tax=Microbacterium maritypicum TaxID=33918 RepID=A0ACD4B8H4_MICMQ|nr:helix-turn-helix domain-containing protein [Microbacterium liquefaciens]UTT53752.1 helix-turn-helix domain-containing protein [Microbacterium liquefaciens]
MSIINPEHPASTRLLDTAEVADILHISERQVARLRQSGKLKCVRITGAAARHTPAQVEAFIAAHSNDA